MMIELEKRGVDIGLLILRVSFGLMLLLHGIHKISYGLDGIKGMLLDMGMPSFFAYGVLVGEVIAPLMVIFGIWTRIGASIMAFNMVVAIAMAHSGALLSISVTGGLAIELPATYLFAAVALIFTGGGSIVSFQRK